MEKPVHNVLCLFTAFSFAANTYLQLGNYKKQQLGKLILLIDNQQSQLLQLKVVHVKIIHVMALSINNLLIDKLPKDVSDRKRDEGFMLLKTVFKEQY